MTFKEKTQQIIDNIGYKRHWSFVVNEINDKMLTIRPTLMSDSYRKDGHATLVEGRRWLVHSEMSEDQIVKTIWLAVQVAENHEIRETFTYKGKKIFASNTEVKDLVKVAPEKEKDDLGWMDDIA